MQEWACLGEGDVSPGGGQERVKKTKEFDGNRGGGGKEDT